MRRVYGSILLGLGLALFVLGLMSKSFLYERLATVPLDQKSTSVSEGKNMSVLRLWSEDTGQKDAEGNPVIEGHYDKLTDATVRSTREVIGIPGLAAKTGDSGQIAVWQTGVKSEAVGVGPLTYSQEIVTFNRVSGEATGSPTDERSAGDLEDPSKMEKVKHEGLFFKFPFDVQQTTYPFWDGDLGKSVPIKFIKVEDLYGTPTYVFEQVIPQTDLGTRDLPGGVFDTEGNVSAKVMYGNTRTLWVEPNTGVIIKGQEQVDKSLVSDKGTIAATKGTIGYNEATVEENASTWGTKGKLLGFVKGPMMPLFVILGLVLAALGAFLVRKGEPAGAADSDEGDYDNESDVEADAANGRTSIRRDYSAE